MASHPKLAGSRLGRGRGGGIRLTSYSPQFDFSSFATSTISNSTNIYKTFFEKRKKHQRTRQNQSKTHLRSSQYKSHTTINNSSQILDPIVEHPESSSPTMPSPAIASPTPADHDPSSQWTQVTNGAKQPDSTPATSVVLTDNQFEVLSDHENDASVDTNDFGTSEADTDMDTAEKTKRKTKSSRKTKKSAKKSRKSQRKYVKFIQSDSEDESPPELGKTPPITKKKDPSLSDANSAPPLTQKSDSDDDLVDSDQESTQMKNSDIRNFMTSQKSILSQTSKSTPEEPHEPNHTSNIDEKICRKIIDRTSVLNPSTTSTEIENLYRYEMISMLFQWNSHDSPHDNTIFDTSIESLRTHIFNLQKDMDDISHEVRISVKHQEATQSRELKYKLNSQATPNSPTPTDPTLNYGSTPEGGLSSAPEVSEAETLGMNINMMMARPISANPFKPPPVEQETTAAKISMTQFTARFEISTSNTTAINVPLIARQLFRIFKKADRTLRLLPWFPDEDNDTSAIDQEDDIPVEESAIKQWIDNPRIVKSMLNFAMRVESIVDFKHIRDTFVPWMLKNKSHIKLDTLTAREIYGVGFIADIHPRLYNRALFKQFLHEQLQKHDQKIELNVYSRRVWGLKDKKKLSSHAIVIEVDKQYKDIATSALMNIKFPPTYRFAKFIPFDKSIVPDDLLATILLSNNQYQASTRRRVISGLSNIHTQHNTLCDSTSSLREWLMTIQNPSNSDYIFEHVEPSNDDLALIYATVYEDTVNDYLKQITEHLRSHFAHPNDLLSTTKSLNTRTRSKSNSSIEYTQKLTSIFASNPQDPSFTAPKTPPKPKKIYYGAADSAQKAYLNHLMQPAKPAPKPTVTPPHSQSKPSKKASPSTPDPIQQQIMDRLSNLENNVDKKIDTKFQELEAKREADQAKFIQSVSTVVTSSLSNSLPQLIAEQLKVAFQGEGEDI